MKLQHQAIFKQLYTAELQRAHHAQLQESYDQLIKTRQLEALDAQSLRKLLSCQGDACLDQLGLTHIHEVPKEKLSSAFHHLYRGCLTRGLKSCVQLSRGLTNMSVTRGKHALSHHSRDELRRVKLVAALRACELDPSQDKCGEWADHYLSAPQATPAGKLFAYTHLSQRCSQYHQDGCRSLLYHLKLGSLNDLLPPERQIHLALGYGKLGCEASKGPKSGLCQS